jgi:hypothetical protein
MHSLICVAPFRVPRRRPIKRAQLRQRTSPRTQSFLCRAPEMFGRSRCPTDAARLTAKWSVTTSKTVAPVLLGRCISGGRRPTPAVGSVVDFARLVFETASQDQQASVLPCTERVGHTCAWTPAEGIWLVMISGAIAIQRPQGVSGWRLFREGHGLYNSFCELASRVTEGTARAEARLFGALDRAWLRLGSPHPRSNWPDAGAACIRGNGRPRANQQPW